MNIFNIICCYFVFSPIKKRIIFLIISYAIYTITPCQAADNQSIDRIINDSSLLSLLQSYDNLVHFPQKKLPKLADGRSLVNSFKSASLGFAELIKVIDVEKNHSFINNIISQKKNNITEYPGTMISAALETMMQAEEVDVLIEDIKEFKKNIKLAQVDKVMGYALSQIAIDKEAKKISKIEILPEELNPKDPNDAFLLLKSKEFNEKITNKISNTITDISITKLPLITDVNKIVPVEDPRVIAYRPFLYQYFLDYKGELLTDDKQTNNVASELLPEPDVSSIYNARASMQLLSNIIYMNNTQYGMNYIEIKKSPDITIEKWFWDSMDSVWFKRGWLNYKYFQKDGNRSFSRFRVKSTMSSLGADKVYKGIFFRLCYGGGKSKTIANTLGRTTIDTVNNLLCLSALYHKEIFIISGYLGYCNNTNKGYRVDRKNTRHYYNNNSKLYTININSEVLVVLDKIWSFSPAVMLTYSFYNDKKYQEKSNYIESQLFDCLVIPKKKNNFLLGGYIAFKGVFSYKDIMYKPKFCASVGYNFGNKHNYLGIELHGLKAKLNAKKEDPVEFVFSIENTISGKNISSSIKYTLQVCKQFNSNIFTLEFNYTF